MKLTKGLAVIGLVVSGVVIASPIWAAHDIAGSKEPQSLEIVVDHEQNLALVPEGTVIPSGFKIEGSEVKQGHRSAPSALVFAYAPEGTFRALREERARILNERALGFQEPIASGDLTGGRLTPVGGGAIQPLNATTTGTCPFQIWIEYGPDYLHEINCHRDTTPGYNWFTDSNAHVQQPSTTRQTVTVFWSTGGSYTFPSLTCSTGAYNCADWLKSTPQVIKATFRVSSKTPGTRPCIDCEFTPSYSYESLVTLTMP